MNVTKPGNDVTREKRACQTRITFSDVSTIRGAPGGVSFASVPRVRSASTQRRIVLGSGTTWFLWILK